MSSGLAKQAKNIQTSPPRSPRGSKPLLFSGYTYPDCSTFFPIKKLLERIRMNSGRQKVRDALAANKRKKVVVAGLWTEVCNNSSPCARWRGAL